MNKLSALQQKLRAKLEGGQFRFINEKLYTQTGGDSLMMMKEDPSLFHAYHSGYRSQVEGWPINPLDIMIGEVKKNPAAVVGDFGCGEARLASSVKNKVHSFDLVAANDKVVACNIAKVPLGPASLDIAVYCLSLMGTNFMDFLREANRLLKPSGRLLIAEVKSRFETEGEADFAAGGAGAKRKLSGMAKPSGIQKFVAAVKSIGFTLEKLDEKNTMFVVMFFRKCDKAIGSEASALPAEPTQGAAKRPRITDAPDSGKARHKEGRDERTPKGSPHMKTERRHSSAAEAADADEPLMKACIYKRR